MRKLAIGALSFSASVFASCYFLPTAFLLPAALLFFSAAVILIIKDSHRLRAFIICLISLGLGFICFFTAYKHTFYHIKPYEDRLLSIRGCLLDYPERGGSAESFTVKIRSGELEGLKARGYYYGRLPENIKPGDELSFRARVRSADTKYSERSFSLSSKGIFVSLSVKSDIFIKRADTHALFAPEILSAAASGLVEEIFPEDVSAFMKSLLLGDKGDYYREDGLSTHMSRAGLAHIVAISGLHIVFLVSILRSLLGNSRRSSVIGIILIWTFVLITGRSHSAVRAGIMQTVLLSAPLFNRENDPPTSLSFALALILIVNPYAAGNVGLQLSFAATAGILLFTDKINACLLKPFKNKRSRAIASLPAASVSASVGAMVFTLPLTAVHFGSVSLYSPISNVLCFWAVSLCFGAGFVCCLLGLIIKEPAIILARLIAWPARYIMLIARFISRLPLSLIFMDSFYGPCWLILSYALFTLALLSRESSVLRIFLPTVLSLSFLLFFHGLGSRYYDNCAGVIAALDVGQGQCLCLSSGDTTVMYDCGGMGSSKNAGDIAAEYLQSSGRDDVDLLILSHMQKDHVNGVKELLELCEVERIIIPHYDYSDNVYYEEVLDSARRHDTAVTELHESRHIYLEGMELELMASAAPKDINDSSISILASIGSFDMLATGDASEDWERELIEKRDFQDIELLIAGHHGSKNSSCREFLSEVDADTAIISCGYNSYGHPHHETLERLSSCGYNILRTDLDSTVEIRIGLNYG